MRYPEQVYLPTDYDVAKAIILPGRCGEQNTASGLLNLLAVRFGPVPNDRVLILLAANARTTPGGAQTTTDLRISVTNGGSGGGGGVVPSANEIVSELVFQPFTTAINGIAFSGEAHLMPGEFVYMQAGFSGNVASNFLFASYHGILVPRANYQFNSVPKGAGGI